MELAGRASQAAGDVGDGEELRLQHREFLAHQAQLGGAGLVLAGVLLVSRR